MPETRGRKSKYISYLLRFGVAGVALYLVFRGEDVRQVAKTLAGLNPWIVIGVLGIYFVSQLIFVARWSLLLKVHSIKIGFWPAVRLHFLGLFYNNCLPSAVGGDILRAWYVTKHTEKKLEAALSVFVDRMVGLTAMLIMAAIAYLFVPAQRPKDEFETRFAGADLLQHLIDYKWYVVGVALMPVVALAALASTARGRSLLGRGLQLLRLRGVAILSRIASAIRIYWTKKSALVFALLLAFCCQSLFILGMWLMGRGIGVTAHIKYYFIFFPISWLLGSLPISVGGAGITELWLKTMFIGVCDVSSKNALALALCQRLVWLFGSLPGAVIHLVGAHLPKDFFVDYDESIN
jgi:uncharacterized protein (TIRG00374 family)